MAQTQRFRLFGGPLWIWFVIFVPGHMFNWALEWVWLVVQLLISLAWLFSARGKLLPVAGIAPRVWTGFFMILTAAGVWASIYGATAMNLQISTADMSDFFRFLLFIPLALFIGSATDRHAALGLGEIFKVTILFNLATVVILLLNIPVLADAVMLVYEEAKVQIDYGHIRIGIPFTNPNFAALIFILALSYFAFFRKSALFVLLTICSIFLTGSRSGMLAALPIILVVYGLFLARAVHNAKVLLVLVLGHLAILIWLSSALEAVDDLGRVVELFDAIQAGDLGQVDTAAIRFDLIHSALGFIERSPWFGIGPGRSYGLDITDSQLVAWPVMYGIPLALMLYFFFAWIFVGTIRVAKSREHTLGLLATALAFFLMLATGDFMKNYRVFFITVLFAHCMNLVVAHARSAGIGAPSAPGD